jgi:hypothetical protein
VHFLAKLVHTAVGENAAAELRFGFGEVELDVELPRAEPSTQSLPT